MKKLGVCISIFLLVSFIIGINLYAEYKRKLNVEQMSNFENKVMKNESESNKELNNEKVNEEKEIESNSLNENNNDIKENNVKNSLDNSYNKIENIEDDEVEIYDGKCRELTEEEVREELNNIKTTIEREIVIEKELLQLWKDKTVSLSKEGKEKSMSLLKDRNRIWEEKESTFLFQGDYYSMFFDYISQAKESAEYATNKFEKYMKDELALQGELEQFIKELKIFNKNFVENIANNLKATGVSVNFEAIKDNIVEDNKKEKLTEEQAREIVIKRIKSERLVDRPAEIVNEEGRDCWRIYYIIRESAVENGYVDRDTGEVNIMLGHGWEKI